MGADLAIEKVVLFDGVCNLCNASVQFIIKRNKKKNNLRFASLQSSYGQKLLQQFQIENNLRSIVYFQNGKLFFKSDAVLEIVKELDGLWPVLRVCKVIPHFLRDFIYDLIAMNRYRWFGKRNECWLPTKELNNRFLTALAAVSFNLLF